MFSNRVLHSLLDCSFLQENFLLSWPNLQHKILKLDVIDGPGIVSFLNSLDRANKALFFLGSVLLPFQKQMCHDSQICQRCCL